MTGVYGANTPPILPLMDPYSRRPKVEHRSLPTANQRKTTTAIDHPTPWASPPYSNCYHKSLLQVLAPYYVPNSGAVAVRGIDPTSIHIPTLWSLLYLLTCADGAALCRALRKFLRDPISVRKDPGPADSWPWSPILTRSLAHSPTDSLTPSLTHSLPLSPSPPRSCTLQPPDQPPDQPTDQPPKIRPRSVPFSLLLKSDAACLGLGFNRKTPKNEGLRAPFLFLEAPGCFEKAITVSKTQM